MISSFGWMKIQYPHVPGKTTQAWRYDCVHPCAAKAIAGKLRKIFPERKIYQNRQWIIATFHVDWLKIDMEPLNYSMELMMLPDPAEGEKK